jgi:hypothetical protein
LYEIPWLWGRNVQPVQKTLLSGVTGGPGSGPGRSLKIEFALRSFVFLAGGASEGVIAAGGQAHGAVTKV